MDDAILPLPFAEDMDLGLFGLRGKLVVVTGAASGIGRAASLMFAQAGAILVLADLDGDGLSATARMISARGGTALAFPADCGDPAAIEALADNAARTGPLEVWCNVAGIVAKLAAVDVEPSLYGRVMDTNMGGYYWGCVAAARRMIANGGGAIVNVSSNAADEPIAGLSLYAMAKAGVNMMTRSFAKEWGPQGIRVNAVAPGFTVTPMTVPDGAEAREAIARNAARSPLNRVGAPDDIAFAMLYLASEASRFVTGQVLRVNGGSYMA